MKSRVQLCICEYKSNGDDVTQILGIKPTRILVKGDPVTYADKAPKEIRDKVRSSGIKIKYNKWLLEEKIKNNDIDFHINDLIKRFNRIPEIRSKYKNAEIYITCFIECDESRDISTYVELETLRKMVELGIGLEFVVINY
jgi:hypothetical protein